MNNRINALKIIHLPDYHIDNPYQNLLNNNLADLGFNVSYGKTKIYFTVIDLSLFYNLIKDEKFHIFHLHWQHPFLLHKNKFIMVFKGIVFIFQLLVLRILGIKMTWTVHNLKNHENKNVNLENIFCKTIAKLSTKIITHCHASKIDILNLYKIERSKVYSIPQGNYLNVYRDYHTRQGSKVKLGLKDNDFTFVFIGLIRPYKGILGLIESFKTVSNESARLIIAGRVEDKKLVDLLKIKAKKDCRITLKQGYIDNNNIEIYLKAADIVVLPYEDIINSGSAILAMSYGKVIIAPRIGCIPELLNGKYNMLYDPTEPNALAKVIAKALENKNEIQKFGAHNLEYAKKLDWKHIAEKTGKVYLDCFKK